MHVCFIPKHHRQEEIYKINEPMNTLIYCLLLYCMNSYCYANDYFIHKMQADYINDYGLTICFSNIECSVSNMSIANIILFYKAEKEQTLIFDNIKIITENTLASRDSKVVGYSEISLRIDDGIKQVNMKRNDIISLNQSVLVSTIGTNILEVFACYIETNNNEAACLDKRFKKKSNKLQFQMKNDEWLLLK